jgi:hypothetical protein
MPYRRVVIISNERNIQNIKSLEKFGIVPYETVVVSERNAFEADYERVSKKEFEAGAVRLQGSGQAEVEAGVINEEDGVGFFPGDALEGLVEFLAEVAVASEDVPEADNGRIVRPVFGVGAHGVELGAAQAGDL